MSLPSGFRVRVAEGVIRAGHGRVLVGGSPLTVLTLSDEAFGLVRDGVVEVNGPSGALLAARMLATNLAQPEIDNLPPTSAADITVVIPVHDRAEQLDRALVALAPLRCIVVDDASANADQIADVAQRRCAELVRLEENVGPAGARNAGLARVTTQLVALVDSDVQVRADDLLTLTRHFADPSLAIVGPRMRGRARSSAPRWFERYDVVHSSLSLGRAPARVRPGSAVAWLPSACLIARTSSLGNGFDETMRVGEDVDLVWRTVAAGGQVHYDPSVEAAHDTRNTMHDWLERKFVYGTSAAILAMRHGDAVAPAALSPLLAAVGWLILQRRGWSLAAALLGLTASAATVRRSLPDMAERDAVAARLAARGAGWAVRQESALLLRHWWPVAIPAAVASRSVRRALATALIVDTAAAIHDHRHRDDRLPIGVVFLGRRLEDLAYGAGVWWGACSAGSLRALRPRRAGVRQS